MRRYLAWALAATALVSSCKMYEDLPTGEDKPALYITKEMEVLDELLQGSEHGWRMVLLPGSYQYGGINLAFKFGEAGAVETHSEDLEEVIKSTYHFYNASGIRLTFDTRNPALGRYSEPRNTLLQGLEGDFEFTVGDVSANKDTIELIGAYSHNRMQLIRLKESPKSYIDKVKEVRQALYGKALHTTTIGGKQVKMSIFGLIRQLQVKVGDEKERMLPIYFTPEGMEVIAPEDLIDERDASKGQVGQIGTEFLRQIKVEKDGTTYHALSPSGEKLEIQSAYFDLTKYKIRALFYEYWAGDDVHNAVVRTNGAKYQSGPKQGQDSIIGEITNDPYYSAGTQIYEFAYIGKTDGGDHKVSLKLYRPNGDRWLSYYLDFAPVSDEPAKVYFRKFIQDGNDWRYNRNAMRGMIDALVEHSPYRFTWIESKKTPGVYEYSMHSVANDEFWMSISDYYEPGHPLSDMPVRLNGFSY